MHGTGQHLGSTGSGMSGSVRVAGVTPELLPPPEAGYRAEWDRAFYTPLCAQRDLPTLTIVTPSFNQGKFIEQTIRNILLQNYPSLEFIIIDGGSSDDTLKMIRKYEPWISRWVSEPDHGMYDALNKGFAGATGEIMAWSPTGDLYVAGALQVVGSAFHLVSELEWLTSAWKVKIGEQGDEESRYRIPGFSQKAFRQGLYMTYGNTAARYTIQQQSTFWRRNLWQRSGGRMDDTMKGAGDFELWSRFFAHAELHSLEEPIGIFRTHAGQESVAHAARMKEEAERVLLRSGGKCLTPTRAKWARRLAGLARDSSLPGCLGFGWQAWSLVRDPQTNGFRRKRCRIIP
jgi:hypothetical protein